MSEGVDLIYDRLVADEKLKSGTKYERLAAIAFRELTDRNTVHDLRLVGDSEVAHQIDAVVGDEHRRVLIEAKDYDTPVGLGIVRDFWGVVDDICPDEAFIVTTDRFTAPAIKFAAAKGVRLAVLRPPREEDWQGFIRSVHVELRMTAQAGLASVQWQLHPDDHQKLKDEATPHRTVSTDSLFLADANGVLVPFYPGFKAEFGEEYGKVPLGGQAKIGRVTKFREPTWLHGVGPGPLRMSGYRWFVDVVTSTDEFEIAAGVGELAAELVLRTVDGEIGRMFSGEQIQSWTFDGKQVVPS